MGSIRSPYELNASAFGGVLEKIWRRVINGHRLLIPVYSLFEDPNVDKIGGSIQSLHWSEEEILIAWSKSSDASKIAKLWRISQGPSEPFSTRPWVDQFLAALVATTKSNELELCGKALTEPHTPAQEHSHAKASEKSTRHVTDAGLLR